jgi:hypothetical protein
MSANEKPKIKTDDEWFAQLEKDDDNIRERYEARAKEEQSIFAIDRNNLATECVQSIGTMQRFNDELTRLKLKRQRVSRLKNKLYMERYNELKDGSAGVQVRMNTKHEYDMQVFKSPRYQRTVSYLEMIDILVDHIERSIKSLSQKIFVLQSMMKDKEREIGPF